MSGPRALCPGELRFRLFHQGPGKHDMFVAGPVAGVIAGAMGTMRVGLAAGVVLGAVLAGVVVAVEYARRPPIERNAKIVPVQIEVTPWGLSSGKTFRWSDIRSIEEHTRVVKRRDESVTVHVLYIEIEERHYLQAQAESFDAPTLAAVFPRFGPAVRRRFAVGAHGESPAHANTAGLANLIIDGARRIVAAGEPAAWFERVEGQDYRARGGVALTAEATAVLLRSLRDEPDDDVDAGPLHAVVLAECGVVDAIEPLLALTMSPSPVVAAAARAAAMRLGASQVRTGPIDEMRAYLSDAERAAWSAWAQAPQSSAKSPSGVGR